MMYYIQGKKQSQKKDKQMLSSILVQSKIWNWYDFTRRKSKSKKMLYVQ